jgi:hypothetical protein
LASVPRDLGCTDEVSLAALAPGSIYESLRYTEELPHPQASEPRVGKVGAEWGGVRM